MRKQDPIKSERGQREAVTAPKIRGSTASARVAVPLRLTSRLYERLSAHCHARLVPANTFIVGLLTEALAAKPPRLPEFRDDTPGTRTSLTVRMAPALHERLLAFCSRKKISGNAYMCALVDANLRGARSAQVSHAIGAGRPRSS